MNRRSHLVMFVVAALALLVGAPSAMYWLHRRSRPVDPKPIVKAIQAFCRDQRTAGKAVPENIALRDLVAAGYLEASDVRAFDGIEVSISTTADEKGDEIRPQSVLIRARLPDGTEVLGLGDGSAAQVTGKASTAQVTGKPLPRAAKGGE